MDGIDANSKTRMKELREEFESAWQAGQRPALEACLTQFDEHQRHELLRTLLPLEIKFRRGTGEVVTQQSLRQRFPQMADVVDEVFAAFSGSTDFDPGKETVTFQSDHVDTTTVIGDIPESEALAAELPNSRFADFDLLEELGRGGMGVVYKARQQSLNRIVALKMIRAGQLAGPDDMQRFLAEAQASAKLDHPGIVPVFEVGESDGQPFFVMGFVEGQTLSDMARHEPLDPERAAELVKEVGQAVHYAHEQSVVHRDLKPSNVLVDRAGKPRVMDFGLAKTLDNNKGMTVTGDVLGTPAYMPPEQAQGRIGDVGVRSDVYSLGAMLYDLLTGRPPFLAANVMETLQQVVEQQPVSLRQLNSSIPKDLETISLKCLQKEPEKRYATAKEVCEDLSCYLEGKPIAARPVSRVEKMWRWCKRHPAAASVLLLLVCLLFVSIGAVVWVNDARRNAEIARDETRRNSYASEMNVAGSAAETTTGAGRVRQLVDPWLDEQLAPDPRGWEWYFLLGVAHQAERVIQPYTLDERQGKSIEKPSVVQHIAFSPDGNQVFIAGATGIDIYDLKNQQRVATLPKPEPFTLGLAIDPTGQYWAVSGEKSGTIIRKMQTQKTARVIDQSFGSLQFSPNGDRLAIHTPRHYIQIEPTQAEMNAKAVTITEQVDGQVPHFAFSPDGAQIASAGWNGSRHVANIWNASTGELLQTFDGHPAQIGSIAFSTDGKWLASGSFDRMVKVWNLSTKNGLPAYGGHEGQISAIAFGPDSQIASTGWDLTLHVRNVDPYAQAQQIPMTRIFRGHTSRVNDVEWSPKTRRIATCSDDGSVRIWNPDARPPIQFVEMPAMLADDREATIDWHPDSNQLLIENSGLPAIYDCQTDILRYSGAGQQAKYSSDGSFIVTMDHNRLNVFDLKADRITSHWQVPSDASCVTYDWHPKETKLAVLTGSKVWIWEPFSSTNARMIFDEVVLGRCVVWSPQGDRLAVGEQGGVTLVLDAKNGDPLEEIVAHYRQINDLAWDATGNLLAAASNDAEFSVINVAEQKKHLFVASGHTLRVHAIDFHPDGSRLATGGGDKTVKLWDAVTGQQMLSLRHDAEVRCVRFSSDGKRLASFDAKGKLKIFDATRGYEVAEQNAAGKPLMEKFESKP